VTYPIFLDFEASSLSKDSYPIEVAWSKNSNTIESHLININKYPLTYTDWNESAESLHGLSRNYLNEYGEEPRLVASKMLKDLDGHIVYTTAPKHDEFWCNRLFYAVNIHHRIEFRHIESLIENLIPSKYWYKEINSNTTLISYLYKTARDECNLKPHRANNDVSFLVTLYSLAIEQSHLYK